MARDIREMLKNHKREPVEIPHGHEARFEAKLNAT